MFLAFGVGEFAAGVGLFQSPAHPPRMWQRVLGDAMDLGPLGLVARKSPGNRVALGALAFVAGATALDIWVARGRDRATRRTLTSRAAAQAAARRRYNHCPSHPLAPPILRDRVAGTLVRRYPSRQHKKATTP